MSTNPSHILDLHASLFYHRFMPKQEGVMIQSVERALSLLGRIADHPEEKYSLTELTEFLGIDKSSVFRLLSTLIKHNLVRQEEGKKGYQLGFGIYSLAAALRDQLKLTELASPVLKRLAYSTEENAHLAVRSGTRAVFIDRERATKTIAANTNIGDSEDLHCTAVGKCLACEFSRTELEQLFDGTTLTRYTDRTICDLALLAEELAVVRERGYALDREENESHVVCLAAPVYNFERIVEASIGISGPRDRIEGQLEAFATEVLASGRRLSALMGGAKVKPSVTIPSS
jgi:DNA-binding IclR family transcriptional regulator